MTGLSQSLDMQLCPVWCLRNFNFQPCHTNPATINSTFSPFVQRLRLPFHIMCVASKAIAGDGGLSIIVWRQISLNRYDTVIMTVQKVLLASSWLPA